MEIVAAAIIDALGSRLLRRQRDEQVIAISDSAQEDYWTLPMKNVLSRDPAMVRRPVGSASSCIYKVPLSLAKMNRKYFDPCIISIGLYHHGCGKYDFLQEDKARYFNLLVTRSTRRANHYFEAVKGTLDEIKSCYSESIGDIGDDDLVVMIVTDGCFIIEMFRMVKGLVPESKNDPILNMAELFPFLLRDFMLLENQIPFFVLELLFNMSKTSIDGDHTLINLAVNFFKYAMPRHLQFKELKDYDASKVMHLLDLLRLSVTEYAPMEGNRAMLDWEDTFLPRIPPASKLHIGGISIKQRESIWAHRTWAPPIFVPYIFRLRVLEDLATLLAGLIQIGISRLLGINTTRRLDNLINIKFDDKTGRLKIPTLILDDFVTSFLSNCVAFENCADNSTKHFSTYVTFMRCLTKKEADAEFLSDNRVLENYIGTDADVVDFFNDLAGGFAVDIRRSYLADVFYGVNKAYENIWNRTLAELWNKYFSSPWSFLSALAVLIGLILTSIQTYYAFVSKK